jgi:hypothetical protein
MMRKHSLGNALFTQVQALLAIYFLARAAAHFLKRNPQAPHNYGHFDLILNN